MRLAEDTSPRYMGLIGLLAVEASAAFSLTIAILGAVLVGPPELALRLYGPYLVVISVVSGSLLFRRTIIERLSDTRYPHSFWGGMVFPGVRVIPPGIAKFGLALLMITCAFLAFLMWPGWSVVMLFLFAITPEANRRALKLACRVPITLRVLWIAVPFVAAGGFVNYFIEPLWRAGTIESLAWAMLGMILLFAPAAMWLAAFHVLEFPPEVRVAAG